MNCFGKSVADVGYNRLSSSLFNSAMTAVFVLVAFFWPESVRRVFRARLLGRFNLEVENFRTSNFQCCCVGPAFPGLRYSAPYKIASS